MKKSASSVRERRHGATRTVTPKINVRYVKFTPAEMAYDLPAELDPKQWISVGRGPGALFNKPPACATVHLDPDIATFFGNEKSVNQALRKAMELMKMKPNGRRRKSA